jgi:chaperone required for assembly of F1-ATPase
MKRFYKNAAAEGTPHGFRILLDGKPVQTPARNPLILPTQALADAVAKEWQEQGDEIVPTTMPLTRMANTVLDGVRATRDDVIVAILRFGEDDLLAYRAEAGSALAGRQQAWDTLLDWAAGAFGARLTVAQGIGPMSQPDGPLAALREAVAPRDDFALAALHVLASITGSLVLGLAVLEARLEPGEAFALSRLDEAYQAEIWGQDAEAHARALRLEREMEDAARLVVLTRS